MAHHLADTAQTQATPATAQPATLNLLYPGMTTSCVLSADAPDATPLGTPTMKGDVPVQRFSKKVIPVGRFVKRNKNTGEVIFELNVTDERQQKWVNAFKAMKEKGIPVRLKDATGNYSLDMPQASPLTKNHAGVFDKNPQRGLASMVENIVGETVDMYVKDGWLTTVHDVEGQASIDLVKKAKFTSPEIQDCYFDGTDKGYGEVIRAISLVSNPLVPGQPEFETIAASDDSPEILILSHEYEAPMKNATALLALVAAMAGMSASKVTEDNAVDVLEGVKTRFDKTTTDLKALSDEQPVAPSKSERRSVAKLALNEFSRLQTAGVVSDAGVKQLSELYLGKTDTEDYAPFILSAEDSDQLDDRSQLIEKNVEILLKNPGLKKGTKTTLQDPKALSEEGEEAGAVKTMTDARYKEVMNMTPTGREVVNAASSK